MTEFTVYDIKGKILRSGYCPDKDVLLQASTDEFILPDSSDDSKQYVENNEIVNRPLQQTTLSNTSILANGVDSGVLQYLPIPCTVFMNGEVYEVTDGLLELSFDTPGEYQVTVSAFPYLDKTFTIEAL